ncbi:hybrid sensor histidine kinase/response regulator transcription factor [Pedobacter sp. AW31-3R]|uniref:hybrid sensor histidine kinase/response regulator transcription factor n=1 Tax=Pedobacter sp. AW31-3R TaxID=3445781 RepID=UPI003F9EBDB3
MYYVEGFGVFASNNSYFSAAYSPNVMRPERRRFLLIFMIVWAGLRSSAQQVSFDQLTVRDGLAQNTVLSIVKDKYGFMWFGTYNGLCRYDGYKFRTYTSIEGDDRSLPFNRIHHIYKDKEGTLWVTTFANYICRYNYKTDDFTKFKLNELPKALVDSCNRLKNMEDIGKLSAQLKKWIGPFAVSITAESIVFQKQGAGDSNLDDRNVNSVYLDNNNLLWVGTVSGGVNKGDLRGTGFRNISLPNNNKVSNAEVRAILADRQMIWMGSQDQGLIGVDRVSGHHLQLSGDPQKLSVRSLLRAGNGSIWVGYRNGLEEYFPSSGKMLSYSSEETTLPKETRFLAIAEDPVDHSIWFGTNNGLLRFDTENKKFGVPVQEAFTKNTNPICLFFDSSSNLWIGTEYSGLIKLNRRKGSAQFGSIERYNTQVKGKKIPDDRIYTIAADEKGNIWAGTANGLCKLDPKTGAVQVIRKGLRINDQYISKLLADGKGSIWMSTKKGISRININTGTIRNYVIRDGLSGGEFIEGAGFRDPESGELFFGGIKGSVTFSPEKISDNPYPPVMAITELQVLNHTIGVGEKIDGRVILPTALNLTKEITLSHQDRSFSIEFAALHYSSPQRNEYKYMLEGIDKEWISTDATKRTATYVNLPDGNYTFKVLGSSGDGLWSKDPKTLLVTILPPWWRTWYAYAGYLIILLLMGYLTYRLLSFRAAQQKMLLMERLKNERAMEMNEMKSGFFTNVSHEFRTPLTLILDPLRKLMEGKVSAVDQPYYYEVMYRNTERLLGLTNQLLDFRKIESGFLHARPVREDFVLFIQHIVAAFQIRAEECSIKLEFHTKVPSLLFGFDPDIMGKALYNLLSNAFKFTANGGHITVSLEIQDTDPYRVVLSVTDDGEGIAPEYLERIFEPFYQAPSKRPNALGSGIGLSLTRELIHLLQGKIDVSSIPGQETCFAISLIDLSGDIPLVPLQAAKDKTLVPVKTANAELPTTENTDRLSLLIVEDNPDIRQYLKISLCETYTILEAENGQEGFQLATAEIPDLIISDVMMPGVSGLELCQKLKGDERTSHIPIILLTARQSDEYRAEGYELGADDYIVKPFNTNTLRPRIANLINGRKKLRQLFNHSDEQVRTLAEHPLDQAFIAKATGLITGHLLDSSLGVEWLAENLNLSRTQLYRKIKALTDQSVHEFITAIRLHHAAGLLRAGGQQISEIAYLVGYADATSFARNFQKQFGVTPKKFSQQGKEQDS